VRRFGKWVLIGLVVAAAAFGALVLIAEDVVEDETSDRPDPDLERTETATTTGSDVSPTSAGELPEDDAAAVEDTVRAYVAAINRGHGIEVCRLVDPISIRSSELPSPGGGCARAVEASLGHRRPGGTPAWERTTIQKVTAVSVGEGEARVTATVTHDFADRKYVSVEEDVIYLREDDGKWVIAKPSGTFYRAIGYPEPPLEALKPPGG
jgi:hypothetical protein